MGPVPKALKRFIWDLSSLIDMAEGDEREVVTVGKDLVTRLLAEPDWLPPDFAQGAEAGPVHYQIYEDPTERFFIFSEIWLPGQQGPTIDHGVWTFLGVLSGAEQRSKNGAAPVEWSAGSVDALYKRIGYVTQSAPSGDQPLIAIRVFGGPHAYQQSKSNAADRPGWDIYTIGEAV